MSEQSPKSGARRHWPRLLFAIPFIVVLSVPLYDRLTPELLGIPFFYWFQLSFVLVGAVIVAVVYALDKRGGQEP
ncbi:hypothetical protein A7A08_00481 [Methyloligella halotolerans]|uniref:DUF3311 domain-containing protein n=1 Tax=Methyloligella halotolerans TaxID=1177755 RepID=A0A1E2S2N7_9HYPH|nr:DUF3311 domain-containing protein [Methyloligella halotolerans]ODA68650.1 hypothetical protein A7A08_00481 [Methyloligella halotolerans]